MKRFTTTALTLACISFIVTPAQADWSRFRGPNGTGIADAGTILPLSFSGEHNLKWKTVLPGSGVSSPIVVGDRVYVTCYSGYGLDRENPGDPKNLKRHLVSVDRSNGSIVWSKTIDPVLPEDPYAGIGVTAHGYASHTPVSDGENIYVFFGKTGALAFDRDGKQLWQTSVGIESDPKRWGSASSPILHKNLLIVPATCESESLVGLDKQTGQEVWRQEAMGLSESWSTPILVKVDEQRTDLVIGVAKEIWGLNPDTGKLRWYCEGIQSDSFYSSVTAHDGIIYAIEGRGGGSLAVRAGGKGNVTETHTVWTGKDSNAYCTPIFHKNRIYTVNRGVVTCINAKTGERVSRTRLEGGRESGGRMAGDYASAVVAGDKLYYPRASGDIFVVQVGDDMRQVGINRLTADKDVFNGSPAISKGDLFLRSSKTLYCVADLGQSAPLVDKAMAAAPADAEQAEGRRGGEGRRGEGRGRGRGGRRGFDPQQMFKERDANGDGKLSGDELQGRLRNRMDALDTDKDGGISMEEFRNGMRRGGRGRGGRGGPSREGKPDRPQRPAMES